MRESIAYSIDKEAERIKKIISDGKLYGESVSMDNLDMVIVASYWAGRMAQYETPIPFYNTDKKVLR